MPASDVTKIVPAGDVIIPAANDDEAEYVPGSPYDEVFEELERAAREEKLTGYAKEYFTQGLLKKVRLLGQAK